MNTNLSFMEKLRWRLKTLEHKYQQYRRTTSETAIVETEYGKLKGVKRLTAYEVPYYSFEGIPYAQPPMGELRFRAPQRPTPWEGVRDCTNGKEKPLQIHPINGNIEGSEDCLYLNVYTNNLKPETPRPVMIWIYGGGFVSGEASRDWYGPDYFMQKDVVLVCIQYRLNCLGFLTLDTPELKVPGNAGLKDQVMAIKWIKNNCANFGGNPDCITVFGESAGAASSHYLMLTEQTQGLFHRCILQSGCAIAPWAQLGHAERAYRLAKLVGYKGEQNEKDVLEFLMHAKVKDLLAVEHLVLTMEERAKKSLFPFPPCVEPYPTPDCLISSTPREAMKTAWSNSIPLMVGNTSYEGLLMVPLLKMMPHAIKELETCTNFLSYEVADDEGNVENALKLKKAHVSGETATFDEYLEVYSYSLFYFPMHRLVQSRFAHAAAAPMYLYRFDFDSETLSHPWRIWRCGRGMKGVSHADELAYLFWTVLGQRVPKDSPEYRTVERMVGMWTQFAATGNPNNEQIPGMSSLTWEPLKKSEPIYKCLNINEDLKFIDWPEMTKVKVWESTFNKKKDALY